MIIEYFFMLGNSCTDYECDSSTYQHGVSCTAQCDNGNVASVCSCFDTKGIIMIMRESCVWQTDQPCLAKPVEEDMQSVQDEEKLPDIPTCPVLLSEEYREWQCSNSVLISGTICYARCATGFKILSGYEPVMRVDCHCVGEQCGWRQSNAAQKKVLVLPHAKVADDGILYPTCVGVAAEEQENKFCGELMPISNGFFHCTNGNQMQSKCKVQCNHGFVLNANFAHVGILSCRQM